MLDNEFLTALGSHTALALGLLAALLSGLLIGLEREHHKGRKAAPEAEAAGLRSFTLTALSGALAQGLAVPGLVLVAALGLAVLIALGYYRSSQRDPSLSTELAMLATFLIGVLCVQTPSLGLAAAVLVALLMSARDRLHRFARQWLREEELRDGLMLAALALIVLPLTPTEPLPWLADLRVNALMSLLLLLLSLQTLGYIALRLLGAQTGLALAGLMSGLISSTATIAAMGQRLRAEPSLFWACCAGAVMSTAATWLQASLMLLALAPQAALAVLPVSALGLVLAGSAGLALAARAKREGPAPSGPAPSNSSTQPGPLRLKEAALIALMLSVVTLLVSWAQSQFGQTGLYASVALAALADAHAPVASLAGLHGAGQINSQQVAQGVMLAIACNSLTRCLTAWLTGGLRYALVISSVLAVCLLLTSLLLFII